MPNNQMVYRIGYHFRYISVKLHGSTSKISGDYRIVYPQHDLNHPTNFRLRIAPAHQLHVESGRGAAEGTADPQTAKLVFAAFLGDFWQWEIWGRNGG